MHLRSITMKGFKSFPQRTKLEFTPGVSVIVGPNGSGKSNITDAVLWALGEQSPLAVRGASMKDVIFAGGHGVKGSSGAEVEVVIDNAAGRLRSDFAEISIVRRLERDGEGEYRLNGARCRLVDVLETLSDSGLGKEMHSVVSQGKVEAIVLSRPRERRLLIEEAAGLGKHRKRRRRAQLKLERTEENLSRALDVEREARSRLRPLKRQAEAAELHERLERGSLEARFELGRDAVRSARLELAGAQTRAAAARSERDELAAGLRAVAGRREAAEEAFAAAGRARDALQGRLYAARSVGDRIALRLERARDTERAAGERRRRRLRALEPLEAEPDADAREAGAAAAADAPEAGAAPGGGLSAASSPTPAARGGSLPGGGSPTPAARGGSLPGGGSPTPAAGSLQGGSSASSTPSVAGGGPGERSAVLERELAELDAGRERRLRDELAGLERGREEAAARLAELERGAGGLRAALARADGAAGAARAARRDAERAADAARAAAARAGAELAAVNQFLRAAGAVSGRAPSLADGLRVEPGLELALAAALGPRLAAAVVDDVRAGEALLDRAGDAGGTALVRSGGRHRRPGVPPAPHAEPLLAHVDVEPALRPLAELVLAGVWLVDTLDAVPADFDGVAVTRAGRVLDGARGELAQAPGGGAERLLEERNRRETLVRASRQAAEREAAARAAAEDAARAVAAADGEGDAAEAALRAAQRELDDAAEAVARAGRALAWRREAPDEGPAAVRRAELVAELRAERRLAERAERERRERAAAARNLRDGAERDAALAAAAEGAARALEVAHAAVAGRRDALAAELEAGAEAGERTAAELRACAHEEAELQARLAAASDALTGAEVAAQQVRDAAADAERELGAVASRLGLEPAPRDEPLEPAEREALAARVERLARRREQLGPVNPLARDEYDEAVAHVEELEGQRGDLEAALAELQGLIRETDRRIREAFEQTFDAAARNFEEVVEHLFPGGRGRLRLVRADAGPRPVVGGEGEADGQAEPRDEEEQPEAGVEVEVTPAGKATKRLSLLSGGEKSLVALAFMFAVFLARPCPFYILDEVEAALDDVNIDRFLELVRRYADRAQFIVVTHQKRTMDAADTLYGVSMGGDGVSRVVSRRLSGRPQGDSAAA